MTTPKYIPLTSYREYSTKEMKQRSASFLLDMQRRRSVRDFSPRSVPGEVIEDCLLAAGSAPSGANLQPWRFVVVGEPEVKRRIRQAAEEVEHELYSKRAPQQWLNALKPLGTDVGKPFLEIAPYLIVIFAESFRLLPDGGKAKNYYVNESVGIAAGMLITAVHNVGLVSLTYTPSPMRFLNDILGRPENERPFLVLVVGYPADDAVVPELSRKSLQEIATFV